MSTDRRARPDRATKDVQVGQGEKVTVPNADRPATTETHGGNRKVF